MTTTQSHWLASLRAFATVNVILLHVAAPFFYSSFGSQVWWVATLYDSAVRACVPLFLMLSGALLLPKESAWFPFLQKRVSRVVWPFAFWSAIYLVWHYWHTRPDQSAIKWAYGQLQQHAEYHLWYVYMLLGVYLVIPIIGPWVRSASTKELVAVVGVWTITLFAVYPQFNQYGIRVELRYFSGYLGYVVLGYLLTRLDTSTIQVKAQVFSVLLWAVGFGLTVFLVYHYSVHSQKVSELAFDYLTPNVAFMAIGTFCFVQNAADKGGRLRELISMNSYTIYLAHVLVLLLFEQIGFTLSFLHIVLRIPALTLACLLASTLLAWLINRSPVGKYIGG